MLGKEYTRIVMKKRGWNNNTNTFHQNKKWDVRKERVASLMGHGDKPHRCKPRICSCEGEKGVDEPPKTVSDPWLWATVPHSAEMTVASVIGASESLSEGEERVARCSRRQRCEAKSVGRTRNQARRQPLTNRSQGAWLLHNRKASRTRAGGGSPRRRWRRRVRGELHWG